MELYYPDVGRGSLDRIDVRTIHIPRTSILTTMPKVYRAQSS
jgi:hypothetical protein